jgi:hypothetical protein
MNTKSKLAVAAILSSVLAFAGNAGAAETSPLLATLKPISGPGAAGKSQDFLLQLPFGSKKTVSYFLSENGNCKLSLMVGEAFNGEDVPDASTVRFEVAINPAESARFDTAAGKGLEFTCQENAQSMSVRSLDQVAGYAPQM